MIRGIGLDAVSISRLANKRLSEYAISRLFHPLEVEQAKELSVDEQPRFFASRFGAKEALVKALGTGFRAISPSEICVVTDDLGKPSFFLGKEVVKKLCLENSTIHLSLTHEADLALAFVVVESSDVC
ncbi:MAG: holo-ACP synthase [Sphaerochaetaceae bacterium]|jgi:holo-[acyl-carrier protein] synthase